MINTTHQKTIHQIKRSKARVTIITPTYNRADLIEFTMQSVLSQTYKDYIYVIIDDGSTDNTREIVLNYIKDKKNFFYLYQENMGEADTVNVGWKLSNSEYFLQVNSDDTLEPSLLSEMVATLDTKPEAVVAYPDFFIINEKGEVIEDFKNVDWNFIEALSAFSCYAAAPGTLIRRSAFSDLDKIKDGNYKYINDVKMLWSMALKGDFIHVAKSLASWRSHDKGISTYRYRSINEVMTWADEYFSRKDLPKAVKNIEEACRLSIDRHCTNLIINSSTELVIVDFVRHLQRKNLKSVENVQLMKLRIHAQRESFELEKHALQAEIERLTRSISWRMTKPLRQASYVLKRIIKLKRQF